MIKLIGGRNTGKTKLLLEAANKVQGTVLAENKEALRVKANAYGFYDVNIINYQDLYDGNYYYGEPLFIQKAELFLQTVAQQHGLDLQGLTFTEDKE